ncbi:MAG: Na(+)/H(+) antiporter subunit D, partial [Candidatus Thiodiazotropha taylori]|nr:Na(+)/H(+) antiporter subunit D [Candidatus Thiodiazotropha taylori]MCW4254803.1 Na(+)/H(+) antiporter subunit D [Candidatus Thiodiazotropha taylori]
MSELPPFLLFFAAALLSAFTRGLPRQLILVATPVVAGLYLWQGISPGTDLAYSVMGYELQILRADKLSLLFGYLFCIASFFGAIYALHVKDTKQHIAGMTYAGSALGAVFSGDLITLFIFWE